MTAGVVETFKSKIPDDSSETALQLFPDLIRHGKGHNHREPDPKTHPDPLSPTTQTTYEPPTQDEEMPSHKEAAEEIVRQERAAKSTLPNYKGLEEFHLIEKMGECVQFPHRRLIL